MKHNRILIVEDELIVSRMISSSLQAMGYEAAGQAITGKEALTMTEEQRPHLVLMDIRLPGDMDGIDAAIEIRRRFRIPVIFLTAFSEDETLEKAKLAEPYGYIVKPYDDRALKSSIDMAIHRHLAEEELRRLNRLYDVLSRVNHVVARSRTRGELLSAVCREVVMRGGVDLAWIGFLDSEGYQIAPVASFAARDEIPDAGKSWAGSLMECPAPLWQAIQEERHFICEEVPSKDCSNPVLYTFDGVPFNASGWFPFRFQGKLRGVLSLGVTEIDFFHEREVELLNEVTRSISFALDKYNAELKCVEAESALREKEARLRLFFEHAPAALAMFDREMRYLGFSRQWLIDYGLTGEDLTGLSHYEVFPEISESWKEVHRRAFSGEVVRVESELFERADGSKQWLHWEVRPWYDPAGNVSGIMIFSVDITELKEAEELIRIERDLALEVGSSDNQAEAMECFLDASVELAGMDCGGIYLVDNETGVLNLICHKGMSDDFITQAMSRYEPTSLNARFVLQGIPGYWSSPVDIFDMGDILQKEGIRSLAIIPVKHKGEVVASLNLASHIQPIIPKNVRNALETIASHIGGNIFRIRLNETIKAQSERLQEANTALKVLLNQRENDRRDFGESMLNNIKTLIVPYVEKLKKSPLNNTQAAWVEILDSHLKEVTSSFSKRLGLQSVDLTPTEKRIAILVRDGKSIAEASRIMGVSENTVIFHRYNLRMKLGLRGKRSNLRSYLLNLP